MKLMATPVSVSKVLLVINVKMTSMSALLHLVSMMASALMESTVTLVDAGKVSRGIYVKLT